MQVGFNKSGKVQALDCKLYNNGGNSLDLSAAIMDRALLHVDGAYKIPHVRVVGYCCKTNIASNTAFRGFGGPQVSTHTPLGSALMHLCAKCFKKHNQTANLCTNVMNSPVSQILMSILRPSDSQSLCEK